MRLCKLYILCACLVTISSQAQADEPAPFAFKATYKLFSSGMEIAQMERSMDKSDNEYIYRSMTKTIGLVAVFHKDHIMEQSRWKLVNEQLYPMQYSYSRTKGKKARRVNIDFDWDKNLITSEVHNQNLEMPLEPGVLDKLLYQYAIMRDVATREFPITYQIADGSKMKTYTFERLEDETVQTPLGDFKTIKVQSNGSGDDKKVTIWCAPDLKNLPVKVEHVEDGKATTAVIQTLTGMES